MPLRPALIALCAALTVPLAAAADEADPIGVLDEARTSEAANSVLIGADRAGGPVCFVRETGDSHHLDIGLASSGAFVRLEAPDSDADARAPAPPLRVYAGEQLIEGDMATDRFTAVLSFAGTARFARFAEPQKGFVILADDDSAGFLDVVAAARGRFLVAESMQAGGGLDYVAVYDFNAETAAALAACAAANVKTKDSAPRVRDLAPTLPSPLW